MTYANAQLASNNKTDDIKIAKTATEGNIKGSQLLQSCKCD